MKKIAAVLAFVAVYSLPALPQKGSNPFGGRWDLTVTTPGGAHAQWMEIVDMDGKITGRIQPGGGAVRDIVAARMDGTHLIVTVVAAGKAPAVTWDLTVDGGTLTGTQKQGDNSDTRIAGVRAPELKRPMPRSWTAPEALFNGKDLTGWEPVSNPANNHWAATKDGELWNQNKGSNIGTTRVFDDLKLHIEVNCPNAPPPSTELCNSGIYLRGRYEIQVGSEGGRQASHEMGAIYGYFAPAVDMPLGAGEWQTFDVTLVGRSVTVFRNGIQIHDNREMPGITGGALDSHEGEPGPIFLQGDHDGGMKYRHITIAVPQR